MQIVSLLKGEENIKGWQILLMFFLLSVSGNPYVSQNYDIIIAASFLIPLFHILRNFKQSVSYQTILIFIFFMGYEVMHAVIFGLDYRLTFFKLFLELLLGFVIVDILNVKFIPTLVKTMVLISLISFVFVTLSYIPGINRVLYNFAETTFPLDLDWKGYSTPTIIIYTFYPEFFTGEWSYVRNAGIFWEGGAFAVFLNITLYLHYSTKTVRKFDDLLDTDAIILVIALITTTSTMGIIAMMLIMVFFTTHLKTAVKYLVIVLIGIASVVSFTTVEFLGQKIKKQLAESQYKNNRFGSALMDLQDIAKRPLLGSSRRIEVIFGTTIFGKETHRPNGLTNLLRSYGLVYFTAFFSIIFYSFNRIYTFYHNRSNYLIAGFGVFLLWIVSFSELIFDFSFLKSLLFLFLIYIPNRAVSKTKNFLYPNTAPVLVK